MRMLPVRGSFIPQLRIPLDLRKSISFLEPSRIRDILPNSCFFRSLTVKRIHSMKLNEQGLDLRRSHEMEYEPIQSLRSFH